LTDFFIGVARVIAGTVAGVRAAATAGAALLLFLLVVVFIGGIKDDLKYNKFSINKQPTLPLYQNHR
jgi:tryptophan synthase beta subunit